MPLFPSHWLYRRAGKHYPAVFFLLQLSVGLLVTAGTLWLITFYYEASAREFFDLLLIVEGLAVAFLSVGYVRAIPRLRPVKAWINGARGPPGDAGGMGRRGQSADPGAAPRRLAAGPARDAAGRVRHRARPRPELVGAGRAARGRAGRLGLRGDPPVLRDRGRAGARRRRGRGRAAGGLPFPARGPAAARQAGRRTAAVLRGHGHGRRHLHLAGRRLEPRPDRGGDAVRRLHRRARDGAAAGQLDRPAVQRGGTGDGRGARGALRRARPRDHERRAR